MQGSITVWRNFLGRVNYFELMENFRHEKNGITKRTYLRCFSSSELSDIARQEISKQTNDVHAASEMVRMNVTTWIKNEPSLLILHPENPTTSTNLNTEEFAGPLGLEVNVTSVGNKSKEAHVRFWLHTSAHSPGCF